MGELNVPAAVVTNMVRHKLENRKRLVVRIVDAVGQTRRKEDGSWRCTDLKVTACGGSQAGIKTCTEGGIPT